MKIMAPAEDYPEKYWLKYDHEISPDHLEFSIGKRIFGDDILATFTMKGRASLSVVRSYDFLFSDGPDVISERFAALLLEACPKDVQLLPAAINLNNENLDGYFALNILNMEEAFDLSSCIYTPLIKSIPNGPKKFKKISLLNSTPSFEIFRAAESRSNIILSDRLAETLDGASIKGVRFASQLDGL